MKRYLPVLLFALLFVVACRHDSLPNDVLPQDRMIDFLADAYLLEGSFAVMSQYRFDVPSDKVAHDYDSLLASHALTREQVERSLDYYTAHLDAYQAIHDSVVARLEVQSAAASK